MSEAAAGSGPRINAGAGDNRGREGDDDAAAADNGDDDAGAAVDDDGGAAVDDDDGCCSGGAYDRAASPASVTKERPLRDRVCIVEQAAEVWQRAQTSSGRVL